MPCHGIVESKATKPSLGIGKREHPLARQNAREIA
jgi:hypothetical protein